MENSINDLISNIRPLDEEAMKAARERQSNLAKPAGSLGMLEELSIQVAGIQGRPMPEIRNKVVIVMAADHGVAVEEVSAYPSEVTRQMVSNMLKGGAAINILSRQVGVRVVLVDIGVAYDFPEHPGLINRKIRAGTGNIKTGPAMSRKEAVEAVLVGAEVANNEIGWGADIIAMGEMGIGNSTPSAAIAGVITNKPVSDIVGRGTGVDDEGLKRKITAVERALLVNNPNRNDGLDILAKVGGLEIAGLVGVVLAAAVNHQPVVVDGFISSAAAMIAVILCPQVRDYLIAAHNSREKGHKMILDWLELTPVIDLHLALGEGTGAILAIPIVEASCRILKEMATFSEAGVSNKG